jgi:hypothetical protein
MNKRLCWTQVLLVLTILLIGVSGVFAQSGRGTITGEIKDATGAIVPGAEVVVLNKATGAESKTVTTNTGLYRVPYLEPGNYKVSASLKGFKTAVRDNINLLLAQTLTIDFTLELGEVTQEVTVSAASPLIESSTAEIGVNATERDVQNWPIFVGDGTREMQDFIFNSMPGSSGSGFEGTINGGQAYSHEVLLDGISLGRMDLNGGSSSEFTPTLDAVSEFKLQTGALSSQYGNTQTALTNFGLKSGTNDYHGTAFWFDQSKALNANSWNNNRLGQPKSSRVLNNFGGTLGGPIIKDKTHFFFSYEGNRQADYRIGNSLDSMPVGPFKQGDFSALFDPNFTQDDRSGTVIGKDALGRDVRFGQIYDPNTTRQLPDGTWIRDPFPGNIIPQDRFSTVTQNVLKYDLPNPLLFQLRRNNPRVSTCCPVLNIDNWESKVDHVINEKHKVIGSFVFNNRYRLRYGSGSHTYQPDGLRLPGPAALGDKKQTEPGWIIRLAEDWTISPTKLNHMALGYNRFRNANQSQAFFSGIDWASELGMQNVGTHSFPEIRFAGNNPTLSGGYLYYGHDAGTNAPNGSTIFQDDFTWLRRNHSFRMGGEIRRYYLNEEPASYPGRYSFHNEQTGLPNEAFAGALDATGFAYASFLLGQVQSSAVPIYALTDGIRSQTLAFYFQDDWKVSSKLTLNIGLRWDIPSPLGEVKNRMSGLDPTKPNPGADGYPGAFVVLGDGPGRTGQSNFAETYYKEFGPRFGFAYAANEKTVVRGGYGINYSPPLQDGFNFPYFDGFNGSNPIIRTRTPFTGTPAYEWDTPYPPYTQSLPNTDPTLLNGQDISYYNPVVQKLPYVQNWNLGVQRELPWKTKFEINYLGNKGTRLNEPSYTGSLNQVDPKYLSLGDALLDNINDHPEIPKPYPSFDGSVARALRPFPQYENINTHRLNNGYSTYHSMQVTFTKRSDRGLSFIAAYTFSKSLATADSAGPGDYNFYYTRQDIYNRRADYSVTNFNIPNDLKLTWIYDAPFGKSGRWFKSGAMSYILGGWTVSGIQRYRSGSPLYLQAGNYEFEALFNPGLRGDIVLPRDQWLVGGKPTNPDPDLGTPYLNPAAFAPPPLTANNVPLRLGDSPRYLSQLRGFAGYSENLALIKRTDLGFREGMNLELRLDIINLFNRIGICNPSTDVNDPTSFGRVFGKCGGPRTMQVGARFRF